MNASYVSMSPPNPPSWTESEEVTQFFDKLAVAPSAVLMLDYDGTLAPFTEKRLEAVPYSGVPERLKKLLSLLHNRVVLISGRKAHELQTLIAIDQSIEIWGSHGREHLQLDGTYSVEPLTENEQNALDHIKMELENTCGPEMLESKPNSIAVHWRGKDEWKLDIEQHVRNVFARYEVDIPATGKVQLLTFDGGLEVRAGNLHKGDAVRKLLATTTKDTATAFLGDDATDEDAFGALQQDRPGKDSMTALVRPAPRPSLAKVWLRPPDELLAFMDRWIRIREEHASALENALRDRHS